ncbi:MAG: hypothetical protein IT494_05815 [Gammaproteobacteria bacterium]|nr:hypothetical protein [Gammaproteobacteria bacterium]
MLTGQMVAKLFLRGLGELLVLHNVGGQALLGQIAVEKNRTVFKDRGFLRGVTPAQVATAVEFGNLGAVADIGGKDWQTLTFLGITRCRIPSDLSATRTGLLRETRSVQGDSLASFEGSWYRGFHLMLEHHFLPVLSMIPLPTAYPGATGLAVCDLKLSTLPLATMQRVHDSIRMAVDQYLTVEVEDLAVDSEDFSTLFGTFLKSDAS